MALSSWKWKLIHRPSLFSSFAHFRIQAQHALSPLYYWTPLVLHSCYLYSKYSAYTKGGPLYNILYNSTQENIQSLTVDITVYQLEKFFLDKA